MTETLSKKTLDKIKKEHIAPKPKWQFLLKKTVLWALFVLSVCFGGIASAGIIFALGTNDWEIQERVAHTRLEFLLQTLPYFWIVVFLVFVFIAYYNFKHTPKGYRFRFAIILSANILLSVLLGFALIGMGAARHIENAAIKAIPYYNDITNAPRMRMMMRPEDGVLGGWIEEITNERLIILSDLNNFRWEIDITEIPEQQKERLKEGILIRVIGEMVNDNTFEAEQVLPLERPMQRIHDRFLKEPPHMMRTM
jgi:hypothetical protein